MSLETRHARKILYTVDILYPLPLSFTDMRLIPMFIVFVNELNEEFEFFINIHLFLRKKPSKYWYFTIIIYDFTYLKIWLSLNPRKRIHNVYWWDCTIHVKEQNYYRFSVNNWCKPLSSSRRLQESCIPIHNFTWRFLFLYVRMWRRSSLQCIFLWYI